LGCTVLDKLISQTLPFIKGHEKTTTYTFQEILLVIGFYCRRFYLIPKQIRLLATYLIGYITVLLLFIAFIFVNGSIVVGDKSAHEAALHIPQVFYFSLFSLVFGPSICLTHLPATLETLQKKWYLVLPTAVLFSCAIYYNTLIHPYLLADNRHYIFYIWNKFYGKYAIAKYALIPVYIFALTSLYQSIAHKSAGFRLVYVVCTVVSIALQKLIELRYFIIPFLLFRLNAAPIKFKYLIVELTFHLILNAIVFYIFVTKEIYWNDYDFVQRLIW